MWHESREQQAYLITLLTPVYVDVVCSFHFQTDTELRGSH